MQPGGAGHGSHSHRAGREIKGWFTPSQPTNGTRKSMVHIVPLLLVVVLIKGQSSSRPLNCCMHQSGSAENPIRKKISPRSIIPPFLLAAQSSSIRKPAGRPGASDRLGINNSALLIGLTGIGSLARGNEVFCTCGDYSCSVSFEVSFYQSANWLYMYRRGNWILFQSACKRRIGFKFPFR